MRKLLLLLIAILALIAFWHWRPDAVVSSSSEMKTSPAQDIMKSQRDTSVVGSASLPDNETTKPSPSPTNSFLRTHDSSDTFSSSRTQSAIPSEKHDSLKSLRAAESSNPEPKSSNRGVLSLDRFGWNGKLDPNGHRLGWYKDGRTPEDYNFVTYTDENGDQVAYIAAKANNPRPFASITCLSDFSGLTGTAVTISADVKAVGIDSSGASLYARTDDIDGRQLVLKKALVRHPTDWKRISVELDVPSETGKFFFGILLDGQGQVSIKNVTIGSD